MGYLRYDQHEAPTLSSWLFPKAYPDAAFVQATLAQIPWYHLTLLEKVADEATR
jgi:hypothetical protein